MRRILCSILALALLLSGTALAKDFDFVGAYSQYPVVAEGENVTLTVMLPIPDSYANDWKDRWFWIWWADKTGVTFDVDQVLDSALDEHKNLMFASGSVPDMLMGCKITTDEVMRYGVGEGLLLPLDDVVTADVMPNLTRMIEAFPTAGAYMTTPNGHAYTMPFFVNSVNLHGESARVFIDQNRLDAVGLEVPTTLDELVTMLYKFKEADPDCIPLGGSFSWINPSFYVLNALGFLGGGYNWGMDVTVRNGEAVLPAGDPLYKEYLTLMNRFYTDGIISEDFFTADNTTVDAQMAEGLLGIYPFVPFLVTPNYEDFSHWTSIIPLTSEYNDTPKWLAYDTFSVGGFAIGGHSEYGEIIGRMVDFFYSEAGYQYLWMGPYYGTSDCMGIVEGAASYLDWDNLNAHGLPNAVALDMDVESGKYENHYSAVYNIAAPVFAFGANGISLDLTAEYGFDVPWNVAASLNGAGWLNDSDYEYYLEHWQEYYKYGYEPDRTSAEGQFRGSMYDHVSPYETSGYPSVTYFSEDDAVEMNDLDTVLRPYISSEIAKFITGARSLDEFDDYISEIEDLGFRKLEDYYKQMYASYLASLG